MSNVRITVSGAMEDQAARRFVDAWHRAERGETFHERHLAFESWDALARVRTGMRMELLRYVRRHKVTSVRALAKALGLLDASDGGVRADYDAIETKIAI
jgi:predicted transcriptional regulator